MFKQVLPGVAAFLFLLAFMVSSIVGYRLYQVSTAANELLTGQCSLIEAQAVTALESKIRKDVTKELSLAKEE